MDKYIFFLSLFGLGFIAGLDVNEARASRESDTTKWERIEKLRTERHLIERKYEACVASCLRECVN